MSKVHRRPTAKTSIEDEIAHLRGLDLKSLRARWNYLATTSRPNAESDDIKATDLSKMSKQRGGYYSFENGHMLIWSRWADPTPRPAYARLNELTATHGGAKAQWMVENLRNLCLYPNLYLMDQMSSQLRVSRPLAVDKTEVTIYCIAPKNEPVFLADLAPEAEFTG